MTNAQLDILLASLFFNEEVEPYNGLIEDEVGDYLYPSGSYSQRRARRFTGLTILTRTTYY